MVARSRQRASKGVNGTCGALSTADHYLSVSAATESEGDSRRRGERLAHARQGPVSRRETRFPHQTPPLLCCCDIATQYRRGGARSEPRNRGKVEEEWQNESKERANVLLLFDVFYLHPYASVPVAAPAYLARECLTIQVVSREWLRWKEREQRRRQVPICTGRSQALPPLSTPRLLLLLEAS